MVWTGHDRAVGAMGWRYMGWPWRGMVADAGSVAVVTGTMVVAVSDAGTVAIVFRVMVVVAVSDVWTAVVVRTVVGVVPGRDYVGASVGGA